MSTLLGNNLLGLGLLAPFVDSLLWTLDNVCTVFDYLSETVLGFYISSWFILKTSSLFTLSTLFYKSPTLR